MALSNRLQIVMAFLGSLFAGYWMSRRDSGDERVKMNVLGNLAGIVGMVIGYKLGQKEN